VEVAVVSLLSDRHRRTCALIGVLLTVYVATFVYFRETHAFELSKSGLGSTGYDTFIDYDAEPLAYFLEPLFWLDKKLTGRRVWVS
jgi:hypothetical protein